MRNVFRTGRPTNYFKLGKHTQHEDLYHRQAPWPPRSKVKVAMSCDASDRCWPISRERNGLQTRKLVERLPTPRAIMHTSFKVKVQRSRSPARLMLRLEVRHIFRTERPANVKLIGDVHRCSTKTRIADKLHDHQGQRSRSRCHVMRLTGVGPQVENEKSQRHQNW